MNLVELSLRRPVTVLITTVAAVVFGVVALRELPVDLLPEISYPSLTVETEYEGVAPVEIETLLTRPIEEAIGVVNNVVRTSSSSRAGKSEVTLEFGWGTNMDVASLDVRERLDVVRLPLDAERPVLLRYDPSLDPILRIGLTGGSDLLHLRLVAEEEVKRQLERLDGVAAVLVNGGLEEEIQVLVDERRLAALGLDMARLEARLRQENVNITGGRLREGETEFLVRTINEYVRAEDLAELVIDSARGAIVRLADLATIASGAREREVITRIDGRESVEVAVYKEGGTNTVRIAGAVARRLEPLRERLGKIDPTLRLVVVTDQSRYIVESVGSVVSSAWQGGLLAVLVLYLFLRSVRSTLIVALAIPVSVMATFFLMYVFGVSLNIMSLGGLTLGIGMLVDNSIVVLEAIQRQREQGSNAYEAARIGGGSVGLAVAASTLTTVCVFAPIVFVEGVAGQLFGDQALTVTFSLLASLAVALTVVPMLAARGAEVPASADDATSGGGRGVGHTVENALVSSVRGVSWLWRRAGAAVLFPVRPVLDGFDRFLAWFQAWYLRWLSSVLARPAPAFSVALLLLVGSGALVLRLGRELVPEMVQGEVYLDAELPPGVRLEVTERRLQSVERAAAALPGVRMVYTLVGGSAERGGVAGEKREHVGQVTLQLAKPTSRSREDAVIERLREQLDRDNASYAGPAGNSGGEGRGELRYRFGRPAYLSFRTPVEVEIRGFNLQLLERLADEGLRRLRAIPGLSDLKSSTEGGNPELQIVLDRDRLASYGLTVAEVGAIVRAKVQGEVATEIHREERTIDIRVRAGERFRDSVRDLRQLDVRRGGTVPLALESVAEVIETEGPAEIRRSDGSRVAILSANLEGRDLGSVARDIERELGAIAWPPGFEASLGGQRQEMETSYRSLRLAGALAIFMVYLVMASQFESLRQPAIIMASVPFSLIGAVLVLWATRTTVSVVVLIGAVMLAGIVVNNAILLVDAANRQRAAGLPVDEALRAAALSRLRPILMTTGTTVLGLLPMAIGWGEGAELRAPLARTVIGGLLTSTLLTLLLIPTLYRTITPGRSRDSGN